MKIIPHKYQIKAVKHCLKNKFAALFLDLGLGKTVIVLTVVHNLLKRKETKGVLVFAPLRVAYNVWPQEIRKWDHLKYMSCGILHGDRKHKVLREKHDVYIINYEGLKWLKTYLYELPATKWPFDMIVFDESTAVKNSQTKRFKMLRTFIKNFKRRIVLTGTPAPNSLLDVWAQYYVLDEGERLGTGYKWFKEHYFYSSDYFGYRWEPRTGSINEIGSKVVDITMRLKASDYLEMPKLFTSRSSWAMRRSTEAKYKELEREFLLELENETIMAVNAASLSSKLRQFVSGFLYSDGKPTDIHEEKLDVLSEIVDGNPSENMLVAIQFRYEYEMIKRRWPEAPVIYGGMDQKTTTRLIEKWDLGEIPMLVCHPASIAHGVNLQQGGRMLVWFGIPWSWEHYSQMLGRLHRQGQSKPVLNNFIVALRTVEENVVEALKNKEENEASFLKNLIQSLRGHNA